MSEQTQYIHGQITPEQMLRLFGEIGKSLTGTLHLEEVLSVIMDKISTLIKPANWSLLLIDSRSNQLYFEIAVGDGSDGLVGMRLNIGEGIAGWVAEKGESLFIPDVRKDRRFSRRFDDYTDFETQSIICVPLKSKGNVLGVIELINMMGVEGAREFTRQDEELLTMLADFAAIAIENARYFQRVQELTISDDITRMYNSRYMQEAIDRELARAKRYNAPFSLIFLDLDHFKEVNDQHGHLIGTEVLREVAELVLDSLREADIAIRYGGDEFVLLLPETGKGGGQVVAERIRERIRKKEFVSEDGTPFQLSASFGLAAFPEDAETKTELIRKADQAMYAAKDAGRDTVRLA